MLRQDESIISGTQQLERHPLSSPLPAPVSRVDQRLGTFCAFIFCSSYGGKYRRRYAIALVEFFIFIFWPSEKGRRQRQARSQRSITQIIAGGCLPQLVAHAALSQSRRGRTFRRTPASQARLGLRFIRRYFPMQKGQSIFGTDKQCNTSRQLYKLHFGYGAPSLHRGGD